MTTSPLVVRANPNDAYELAHLIAHSFWDLPPAVWLVPEPLARQRALAGQFQIVVEHAFETGHVEQGYCVLTVLVTALIRSWGRRLARLVARAMLGSPLLRW
jgi:hypothetical protein